MPLLLYALRIMYCSCVLLLPLPLLLLCTLCYLLHCCCCVLDETCRRRRRLCVHTCSTTTHRVLVCITGQCTHYDVPRRRQNENGCRAVGHGAGSALRGHVYEARRRPSAKILYDDERRKSRYFVRPVRAVRGFQADMSTTPPSRAT